MKRLCKKCGTVYDAPEGKTGRKVGAVVGGGGSALVGSHIGIAALGGAFSGLLPLLAIGAAVGWLAGKALDRMETCPKCGDLN